MRAGLAIIILFAALAFTPLAGAQEEPLQAPRPLEADNPSAAETPAAAPTSFALPPLEAMEWRAIDAEIRAIRSEAQQAITERSRRQAELSDAWMTRYELDSMDEWELDFAAGKLRRR